MVPLALFDWCDERFGVRIWVLFLEGLKVSVIERS